MLLFLSAVKLVCEIALLSLLGQGLLFILAGAKRETNFFYQLLRILTGPFTRAMRWIVPRQIVDQHIPIAAFLLLSVVWAVVTVEKIKYCVGVNMQGCQ
ncbi:MAG: hypothetical protein Q7S90_03005 [Rubrivivax sp.]|mgnify:CR=1 FL=1|nr:hypothetical protein [Rubrivivax sp.]